jgi:hypothetical protein
MLPSLTSFSHVEETEYALDCPKRFAFASIYLTTSEVQLGSPRNVKMTASGHFQAASNRE